MKLRDANFQVCENNSFAYPPSCILPSFSKNASRLLPPKRLWKCASKIYFGRYKQRVVLLVIYLFNYDSLRQLASFWMWHLRFFWVRFLSNKLEFIAIQRLQKHFFLSLCLLVYTFWNFLMESEFFSIIVIILFYFILTSVWNSHFRQ